MKSLYPLFWILLLALPVRAQEDYTVKKVRFEGNASISKGELLPLMALRPKKGLQRLTGQGPRVVFSRDLLEHDLTVIRDFYQRRGFLYAQAQLGQMQVNDDKETVKLTISIQEGESIAISDIRVEYGAESQTQRVEQLVSDTQSEFKSTIGDRFRDADLKRDINILETRLINNGYPYVEINYTLGVDTLENHVDIAIQVQAGPLCTFGEVSISGNTHVEERLIRKQMAFDRGDIFRKRLVDRSQEQIYGLQVFQIVTVRARIEKETQRTSIPIQVNVREATRFTGRYGVGWGTEDRFRTFLDVQVLRFLGGVRRLNVRLKHSAIEPYHLNTRITQPGFLNPNTTLGLNPFLRRQDEPGYQLERRGANVYVQRQIARIYTAGFTYTYERVTLDTTSIAARGVADPDLTELYDKSSLTFSATQNTMDDLFQPTRGFNNGLTFKYSGIGRTAYYYTKWIVDLRRYQSISDVVLASRLKVGRISPMEKGGFIPVEDRFFSGGAHSVRGWLRHELGPLNDAGQPIGGKSLLEGSLEFRVPLLGSFGSALFWDFGNVWEDVPEYKWQAIRHSLGIGLRFKTPIGPVRFDVARPVNDEQDHYRWHLTIGEAF